MTWEWLTALAEFDYGTSAKFVALTMRDTPKLGIQVINKTNDS